MAECRLFERLIREGRDAEAAHAISLAGDALRLQERALREASW